MEPRYQNQKVTGCHSLERSGLCFRTNKTILKKNTKLILKFGWKVPNLNLSAKILKGVDQLWAQLLLVKKFQTQKHQERTLHHIYGNRKNSTYQSTRSQTQIQKDHHQANMIRLTTASIKAKDAIKIKSIGSARNRTLSNYEQN